MVLAAHFTEVKCGITTTLEIVSLHGPDRIAFRLVRGPVPRSWNPSCSPTATRAASFVGSASSARTARRSASGGVAASRARGPARFAPPCTRSPQKPSAATGRSARERISGAAISTTKADRWRLPPSATLRQALRSPRRPAANRRDHARDAARDRARRAARRPRRHAERCRRGPQARRAQLSSATSRRSAAGGSATRSMPESIIHGRERFGALLDHCALGVTHVDIDRA
jgi:hypothetical protein